MKEEKKYGLDLRRFSNYRKSFPWLFILKMLIGFGFVITVWYLSRQMLSRPQPPVQQQEIEVDVEL